MKTTIITAASIIGLSIFMSSFVVKQEIRYIPVDNLILDTWTKRIYLKTGQYFNTLGEDPK